MKSMTRIFIGLVKCGAWGCFDEFNRLEEATLSAISMQIQPIQTALKARQHTVTLMSEEVLWHNFHFFFFLFLSFKNSLCVCFTLVLVPLIIGISWIIYTRPGESFLHVDQILNCIVD